MLAAILINSMVPNLAFNLLQRLTSMNVVQIFWTADYIYIALVWYCSVILLNYAKETAVINLSEDSNSDTSVTCMLEVKYKKEAKDTLR